MSRRLRPADGKFRRSIPSAEVSRSEKHTGVGYKPPRSARRVLGKTAWVVSQVLILGMRLYQNTLGLVFPPCCRFHPSCSEYAIGALRKFGPLKGGWLSMRRLSRCHPFNPGGYDPLP